MDSLFTDVWTSTFNKILCRQGYIIAKLTRLQGILLIVYTQMKHVTHLRDIEAQYTKTGLGGMWVSDQVNWKLAGHISSGDTKTAWKS